MLAVPTTAVADYPRRSAGLASMPGQGGDLLAARLLASGVRRLEGREHLFCEGDPASHVYRIESGYACIYKMMSDGRRQVVDFAYPGDLIGLGAGSEHVTSAHALGSCRVRAIPAATLHQLASQDAALALSLYDAVSHELEQARDLLLRQIEFRQPPPARLDRVEVVLEAHAGAEVHLALEPEEQDAPAHGIVVEALVHRAPELADVEIQAKLGSMVAYQGDVRFEHKGGGLGRLLEELEAALRGLESLAATELSDTAKSAMAGAIRQQEQLLKAAESSAVTRPLAQGALELCEGVGGV